MNLFVLLKTVPDTVEELSVAADGKSLDAEWLRFKLSDADEHALEQALLLKEKHGGKVTVVAMDAPELDEALFMAFAKGADRVAKLAGELAGVQSLGRGAPVRGLPQAAGRSAAGRHADPAAQPGHRRPRGRDRARSSPTCSACPTWAW